MSTLYPLKFKTIYKDKIWGGQKIKTYLNKDFGNLPNCGETWEISGVKSDVSIVESGVLEGESLADLLEKFKGELVGDKVYERFGNIFPLLYKIYRCQRGTCRFKFTPMISWLKNVIIRSVKPKCGMLLRLDPGSTLIGRF